MVNTSLGRIAILACTCLLATACGGSAEQAAAEAPVLIGWDGQPVTSNTGTTTSSTAPSTAAPTVPAKVLRMPRPVTLPFVDEAAPSDGETDAQPSPDLSRTTDAGIRIEATPQSFDFGDGAEDAILFNASSDSGSVGLYLDPDDLSSHSQVTDTIAWASSAGVVMVLFEVGPEVALITLESADGATDRAEPTSEQIAILAVPGDGTDGVSATAFDGDGAVVATCAPEGEFGFVTCVPLG